MERNEPSTEEVIQALRNCHKTDCSDCVCHKPELGFPLCGAKKIADRLESQKREIAELNEKFEKFKAFHERYAEQTSKKYVDDVCALTARAEQAEAREKAAKETPESKVIKNCDTCFYHDCRNYDEPCFTCVRPYKESKWKPRGQPQEGENGK